jgi:CBS domain-containing protein
VYDYPPGKIGWAAWGLPTEGEQSGAPRLGRLARADVPTCQPGERMGEVRERARRARWYVSVVVNEAGVVLGLLRGDALEADPQTPVDEAMEPGPRCYRPNAPAEKVRDYMESRGEDLVLVTTPDGVLHGLVRRVDLERASAGESLSAAAEAMGNNRKGNTH